MARVPQWLSLRSALSGWVTDHKTENENRVSLDKQKSGFSMHPLVMGQPMMSGVGMQRMNLASTSRLPLGTIAPGGSFIASNLDDINEIGFQRPLPGQSSRLPLTDIRQPNLWDLLATEAGAPLCTQDGDVIGMA